jgi:hypothetical protein
MANINLATSGLPQKQGMPYKTGIVSITLVLIILIGGYVWLSAENKKVANEIQETNNNYMTEYQKLTTSNKEVVDFQNRITVAKSLLTEKNLAVESLPVLEKNLLPQTYLFSYTLTQNKLTLGAIEYNFDVLARQLSSFKKSGSFSAVSVGSSILNDKKKVKSDIVLNFN